MAREILFRGKTRDEKEWIEGFYAVFSNTPFIGAPNRYGTMLWQSVISKTVGQFTGLTDKDGKKIFEGDIVNCYTLTGMNDYRRGVVHWNEMFCGWYGKESCSLLCGLGEIYEVIGNIHDNPELLNGTES